MQKGRMEDKKYKEESEKGIKIWKKKEERNVDWSKEKRKIEWKEERKFKLKRN